MSDSANHLTQEEIDFLRELVQQDRPEDREPPALPIRLDPEGLDRNRLMRMLQNMPTQLVASDGEFELRFRLEWDPTSADAIRVGAPDVVDRRGRGRSARVPVAPGEIACHHDGDVLRDIEVLDVSVTGLHLRAFAAADVAVDTRIEGIRFELPEFGTVSANATVARFASDSDEAGKVMIGLEFVGMSDADEAVIRRYVFSRYKA